MLGKFLIQAANNYSPGWDISSATSPGFFSVASQNSTMWGVFLSPDGKNLYTVGSTGNEINQYTLTRAWDISSASFTRVFNLVDISLPSGLFFSPDGTKLYITDYNSNDVNQYTLSTAWDISSASYVRNYSVITTTGQCAGIFFHPDGTLMYVVGYSGRDVNQYTLSTAWDISSSSYTAVFSVSSQISIAIDLYFSSDGTKMYVADYTVRDINHYNLSTGWDITTASYVGAFSVVQNQTSPTGLFFNPTGTKMYTLDYQQNRNIHEYTLSTSWDLNSTKLPAFFNSNAQENNPQGIFFKPDGTNMYILGSNGDDVNQYTLSTPWDISTASYLRVFSVSGQETDPQDIFFKPDGTGMYVLGGSGFAAELNQYTLSTPWDISTASYLRVFSVYNQETIPRGIFFKPDGTNMYILGSNGDGVNQYTLSTPWDISTVSYLRVFSIVGQENEPRDIFFKPDGTNMYILGTTGDDVNQYTLSTPWDISTASYLRAFSVSSRAVNPTGLFFNPVGKKMFILGGTTPNTFAYNL